MPSGGQYYPSVSGRIISIHLGGWIGRGSPTAHHQHFAIEVKRPRLSCRPRYGGNGADRIRHGVINKGVGRIGKNASRNIAAPTRVDEGADGRGGYVTQRNRQNSGLLHPGRRRRSKLPDLVYPLPSARDGVESAENVQLVLKHGEAAWNNSCPSSRPRSGHWTDRIGHRIIAEDATGRGRGGDDDRAARTIDVRRPGVGEHAASHIVHQVVGLGSRLGRPSIRVRIVFKRMSKFIASCVRRATAHGVKLPVGREIDANRAHAGGW